MLLHLRACSPGAPAVDATRADILLGGLPGWSRGPGGLRRSLRFVDFPSLMNFVVQVAMEAERTLTLTLTAT